ncbi:MAG: metal-dependent hydrolase, partial [Bacteroidota bacterium]|nr:metal-dependent hydrolase [Bacteroidota bacterium]
MDSLTHIVLGACIGEAFFEKGFGKKAMLWGALAQSIPDIDFIGSFWMSTPESLLAHRGFTHSLLFALLMIPLFSLTAARVHRTQSIAFRTWVIFFGTEIFLHLFLDGFNNYGVGWFEPFSHLRFSFNTLYVADPFFSIWAGIGFCMLLILHKQHPKRTFWWKFGVLIPMLYLGYCTVNKISIDKKVKKIFARQHIPHALYFTSPAPLQNWVW